MNTIFTGGTGPMADDLFLDVTGKMFKIFESVYGNQISINGSRWKLGDTDGNQYASIQGDAAEKFIALATEGVDVFMDGNEKTASVKAINGMSINIPVTTGIDLSAGDYNASIKGGLFRVDVGHSTNAFKLPNAAAVKGIPFKIINVSGMNFPLSTDGGLVYSTDAVNEIEDISAGTYSLTSDGENYYRF